ncbi:hypothetical protein Cadr_000021618 [Camelus dromedarius]|uniref:Uncharacterized protein n=1 Tax=Camelus dromedarius TaxID=9838 RepID=A0A5N4CV69_CAMDR|nr:hypothetical protein Cadr_000021618 [Camelus dromedarius]
MQRTETASRERWYPHRCAQRLRTTTQSYNSETCALRGDGTMIGEARVR